jgi:hypothetical protein
MPADDPQADPGRRDAYRDPDGGVGQAQDGLLPGVVRGQFRRDHDDRGSDGGRDQSPGRPSSVTARALRPTSAASAHRWKEHQVGHAQCEADQCGGHPRQRRGHALVIAVPQDEHCRDDGPQAAQEIIGLGR